MTESTKQHIAGIIVALTKSGVIGLNGALPWHYSADLRRFKRVTVNATIIMGRKTWESLPSRPLPQRRNIVITSDSTLNVENYPSIDAALKCVENGKIWFIGGARVYRDALACCDFIDVTHVPDDITDPRAIRFPDIDWSCWIAGPKTVFEDDPRLTHQRFTRY